MHSAEAVWMSSDGHMMLYASFNDSLVEEMHISWFGEGNKALYPDIRSLRYPKVCRAFKNSMPVPVKPDLSFVLRSFSLLAWNAESYGTIVRC